MKHKVAVCCDIRFGVEVTPSGKVPVRGWRRGEPAQCRGCLLRLVPAGPLVSSEGAIAMPRSSPELTPRLADESWLVSCCSVLPHGGAGGDSCGPLYLV